MYIIILNTIHVHRHVRTTAWQEYHDSMDCKQQSNWSHYIVTVTVIPNILKILYQLSLKPNSNF